MWDQMFGLWMDEYRISQSEFLFTVNDWFEVWGLCWGETSVFDAFVFEMCDTITSALLSIS